MDCGDISGKNVVRIGATYARQATARGAVYFHDVYGTYHTVLYYLYVQFIGLHDGKFIPRTRGVVT